MAMLLNERDFRNRLPGYFGRLCGHNPFHFRIVALLGIKSPWTANGQRFEFTGRTKMIKEENFSFKVLIKREPDAWVAHCLELNLVAVAETSAQVESDIMDIIAAHVRYAFENDNVEHMFHPAPPDVWKDFFRCTDREETSYRGSEPILDDLIPIIQANKCFYRQDRHA
jgi:hypothetical protein